MCWCCLYLRNSTTKITIKGLPMKRGFLLLITSLFTLLLSSPSYAFLNLFKSVYTKTKYPFVFALGMGGFESLGRLDYWYQIPNELRKMAPKCMLPKCHHFNPQRCAANNY